jgi:hypothetical protein
MRLASAATPIGRSKRAKWVSIDSPSALRTMMT